MKYVCILRNKTENIYNEVFLKFNEFKTNKIDTNPNVREYCVRYAVEFLSAAVKYKLKVLETTLDNY